MKQSIILIIIISIFSSCKNPTKKNDKNYKIEEDTLRYKNEVQLKNLKQITHDSQFDSFPMFSNDGKKIVFSSNRNNGGTRETNIFIADWVE